MKMKLFEVDDDNIYLVKAVSLDEAKEIFESYSDSNYEIRETTLEQANSFSFDNCCGFRGEMHLVEAWHERTEPIELFKRSV